MPRPRGSTNKPKTVVQVVANPKLAKKMQAAAPAPVAAKKKPISKMEELYDAPEQPVKRGPGRPPKNPVAPVAAAIPAKRGRGRPPKLQAVEVEEEEIEENGTAPDPFESIRSTRRAADIEEEETEEEDTEEEEEETEDEVDNDSFFGASASDEVFSEDFTGESAGGQMAPEGLNRVRCTNIVKDKSKKGDDMYVWDFVVTSGSGRGTTLKLFTSLSAAARWKVIETLEGLGIEANDRVVQFRKSDIVGRTAVALIAHETYNNRLQNSVQKIMTEAEAENY